MTDGIGGTAYAYQPIGNLGAVQLAQQSGPWSGQGIASSTICCLNAAG
jgi:hypothetical protein